MDNNEKREQKVESLIETSRQLDEQGKKAPKKTKSTKGKKKTSKNPFLSPSVMMLFICGLAILISLVAAVVTSVQIVQAEKAEAAAPTLAPEATPVATPFPTHKPIPNVQDEELLSEELYSLTPTVTEWNKKDENPDDRGLYFISEESKYLVYDVNIDNLCNEGYTLEDFSYIWVNSEDNDFTAVINISGEVVDLSGYYMLVRDEQGIYASRVIYNCYDAKEVILKDTVVTGTILAPHANIVCENTYVYGQLVGASYEGTLGFKRDIVFSEYLEVMSVTHGIEFENASIQKRIIELLKSQDTTGAYEEYDLNSTVLEKDIEKILELDLSGLAIRDFGNDLNYFPHIISLNIGSNNINEFDLTNFPNLQALYINNTPIKEIDLSPCAALKILDISNTRMEKLPDFSQVPRLEYLAAENAGLDNVDYSNLQNVKQLNVSSNPKITNFDFDGLPLLEQLDIRDCSLEQINLSGADNLWFLRCSGNMYWVLDLDKAPALVNVEAYTETLTEITAKEFSKRNNASIFYYEELTAIKK